MNLTRYKITCTKCKSSNTIQISDNREIVWGNSDRIISGRFRFDDEWGWQCICGNNDLQSTQEKRYIRNPQAPDPSDIKKVLNNLKPEKSKFVMERV